MTSADISRLSRTSIGAPARPPVAWGVVSRAPVSGADSMAVRMPEYSFDADYQVPAGNWAPKGAALPLVGTRCVVVLDDLGDAWVPEWNGTFVQPPVSPAALPDPHLEDILQQGVITGGGLSWDSTTQLSVSGGTGYITSAGGILTRVTWPFITTLPGIVATSASNFRLDQVVVNSAGVVSMLTGTQGTTVTLANRTGAAAVPAGSMRLHDVLVTSTGVVAMPSATNYRDRRTWARGGRDRRVIPTANGNFYPGPAGGPYLVTGAISPTVGSYPMSIRMECSGKPVRVDFSYIHSTNGSAAGTEINQTDYLYVDGAAVEARAVQDFSNMQKSDTHVWEYLPSAGSHLFEIWSTGIVGAGHWFFITSQPATFVVEEKMQSYASNGSA